MVYVDGKVEDDVYDTVSGRGEAFLRTTCPLLSGGRRWGDSGFCAVW